MATALVEVHAVVYPPLESSAWNVQPGNNFPAKDSPYYPRGTSIPLRDGTPGWGLVHIEQGHGHGPSGNEFTPEDRQATADALLNPDTGYPKRQSDGSVVFKRGDRLVIVRVQTVDRNGQPIAPDGGMQGIITSYPPSEGV